MMLACVPVDADAGVVLRMASNAECAAQAIGADGFQAVIGGPVAAGLLSALVTIFVAIIGYRLILGTTPGFGEGIGRMLRLGFVLALVTGWPVFQTLVYDTATGAPEQLAATILPAAGLSPNEGLLGRVQQVYDAMRLGAAADPRAGDQPQAEQGGAAAAPQQGSAGQPGLGSLPQTASLFAVATIGTLSALHLSVGILLAVAPLAILALLFDGTLGLFEGWLRALTGTVLAGLAATIVTAVALIPIEQEVVRLQGWRGGGVLAVIDMQALPTLVLATGVAMLVATLAAIRMGGALRYAPRAVERSSISTDRTSHTASSTSATRDASYAVERMTAMPGRDRATGVAEALAVSVRREQRIGDSVSAVSSGRFERALDGGRGDMSGVAAGLATAPRRTVLRRSRVAADRDRVGR